MFKRILVSALLAGAATGLLAAILQLAFVQPVLLHAELYESGELAHFGATSTASVRQDVGGIDVVRDGNSILFTMLVYFGYSLILVALMSLAEARGAPINGRSGLIWGLAGFVVVQLAPGLSLPPEVPGVTAGDIDSRQAWWFATVVTAGLALWLIAFNRSWVLWCLAIALLLAPHIVGAPMPDVFVGSVPTEIGALFASRALGTAMAAWVMLGGFAGFFWSREPHA